jgi:hypothetical protein
VLLARGVFFEINTENIKHVIDQILEILADLSTEGADIG